MLEMEHHLRPHCDQLMQDVTSEGKRARERGEKVPEDQMCWN